MNQDCLHECPESKIFPTAIYNRPGLSYITYRIGRYADIRASILHTLNKDVNLSGWTHRMSEDPGIALLEGVAILGDILTFYQELYANEAYLRTARWRESVADLVRLIGYRLSPAVGGEATFAFAVKGDDPVVIPAGFPLKAQVEGLETPADFETSTKVIAYPALSQFSLYRPMITGSFDDKADEFSIETATLEKAGIALAEGDRLMLINFNSNEISGAQIVVIKEVEEVFDHTNIAIEGSWTGGNGLSEIAAYKLGRTFRHFGHNAPLYMVDPDNTWKQIKIDYNRNLDGKTTIKAGTTELCSFGAIELPLNSDVSDLISRGILIIGFETKQSAGGQLAEAEIATDHAAVGSKVNTEYVQRNIGENPANIVGGANPGYIIEKMYPPGVDQQNRIEAMDQFNTGARQSTLMKYFLRRISGFKSESKTWGSLTGPTAVVKLNKNLSDDKYKTADVRRIVVHEAEGEKLTLKPVRVEDPEADGRTLDYYDDGSGYKHFESRKLMFCRKNGSVFETTGTLGRNDILDIGNKRFRKLFLGDKLPVDLPLDKFPLSDEPEITVYGNLAEATQGKTEREAVLGNGDSREIFQTFKLPKAPLTYHLSSSATPPETPELEIRVNNIRWTRASSFFGHKSDEQIYIVREDADEDSWVQFGDGKTGRRLPSGEGNVTAKYRTGVGANGALKIDTNVQAGDKLRKLDKVYLPGKASGGNEAEKTDNARRAAPGKIQSLGRLVSLKDFESEALAISGVSKAKAIWGLTGNIPTIKIIVLMETGADKEVQDVERILDGYDSCRGIRRYPIEIVAGTFRNVRLDVTYGLDPAYHAKTVAKDIREVLGVSGEEEEGVDGADGLFGVNRREFGQREYATRIAGTVQNVSGVLWAEVTRFEIQDNRGAKPNQQSDPDTEVLALPGDKFHLTAAAAAPAGECSND